MLLLDIAPHTAPAPSPTPANTLPAAPLADKHISRSLTRAMRTGGDFEIFILVLVWNLVALALTLSESACKEMRSNLCLPCRFPKRGRLSIRLARQRRYNSSGVRTWEGGGGLIKGCGTDLDRLTLWLSGLNEWKK